MDQPYIVSARKYRPSTFRSVVGQKSLTATLKNAIDSRRLAQAYLFCGPRGVGKTSCARIFAKTINCLNKTSEGEACNECESCRAFNEGRSLNIVELDAASNNSVDDIRNITDQVHVPPQLGRYRVFIIDEVHMLSVQAFNAFLKTLEEPPSYVVFILATTEKHKVIPTILSRCQIYDFSRITVADMVDHLQYVASEEGIEAEPSALGVIARKADGAMRDALSIFDQVAASSRGHITYRSAIDNLNVLDYEYYFRLVDALLKADIPSALLIYKEVRDAGFDSLFFVSGLAAHVRDLMMAKDPSTLSLLEVSDDIAERYKAQSASVADVRWFHAAMEYLNFCDLNYRIASGKQFLVELTLMRIAALSSAQPPLPDPSKPQVSSHAPVHAAPQPRQNASPQPRAAAAPQPRPAPQTVQQRPPVRKTAPGMPQSLHINTQQPRSSSAQNVTPASADDPHPAGSETRSFSADDLLQAWTKYQEDHPQQRILVSAMRGCTPQPTDSPELYHVTLENPAQLEEIEHNKAELVNSLRAAVGNCRLRLEFSVSDKKDSPKRLTTQQLLEDIFQRNPALGEILAEFDTEITA